MSVSYEFGVYLIGFSEEDKGMLQRILHVSSGAVRQYVLDDKIEAEKNKIYLVNADSNKAVAYWCKRYLNDKKEPEVPTAFAGRRKIKGKNIYNIDAPFKASQVLSTFDTMTENEMDFMLELVEHEDSHELHPSSVKKSDKQVASNIENTSLFKGLIVDDSYPVRKQLEIELNQLGVEVESAENGESALEICKHNHYDIIFLDVVMPGIDGYKVCRSLKKYQQTKSTPIIMLTGKSSPFDKVRGSLSGCDSYLTKPLERAEFQEIAVKYLNEVKHPNNNMKNSHRN